MNYRMRLILWTTFAIAPPLALFAIIARPPTSSLVVEAPNLDFGEVFESTRFEWALPIQNRSSDTVDIGGFKYSCNCIKVSPENLRIKPQTTETCTLILDLTLGLPGKDETDRFRDVA